VVVGVLVVLAVITLKTRLYLYEKKKRRDGTAGFWTRPLLQSRRR
jgi:hypothetical protein